MDGLRASECPLTRDGLIEALIVCFIVVHTMLSACFSPVAVSKP
jgi:hypothetical protein